MKQTKKAKAFQLFTQGFTPSSPEIKAVGLYKSNRYKYFYEWQKLGKPEVPIGVSKRESAPVSSSMPSGETVGGVDETKAKSKEQKPETQSKETINQEEQKPEGAKEEDKSLPSESEEEQEKPVEEATPEKPKVREESIGSVSEAVPPKGKEGKTEEPERKLATTIADDGIKCTVFLTLQTLALFRIAATTQAQIDEGEELSLGDFLDTCAEDFFRVRGKKLGLISSGGK